MLALAPSRADEVPRLTVRWHARALAPGEPVRAVVTSTVPLSSIEGRFLGAPLHWVRLSPDASGRPRWSAWTGVPLDRASGLESLELTAVTEAGVPVETVVSVRVEDKSFPSDSLDVASRYVDPPAEVQQRIADERERLAAVHARRGDRQPSVGPFVRPVPGRATSVFGTRRTLNGRPRDPHSGLDLRAATGTRVVAAGAGEVALADELYFAGRTVIVDHGGGLFTVYAHLSEIAVSSGETVEPGQTVGRSGATGRVTGPHLHWGAKVGSVPLDPEALLDPALFGD